MIQCYKTLGNQRCKKCLKDLNKMCIKHRRDYYCTKCYKKITIKNGKKN